MTRFGFYLSVAWQELRDGLRSPLVPLIFCALVGYILLSSVSADYLKSMGGAGVVRNSHLFVYLMTSGQAFWLLFAWAWLFAQIVSRDRTAQLHELVLCAPVSLPGFLLARFLGALALACLLASSGSVGILLIPLLATFGVLPPESVGPTPFVAIVWSWVLFVFPTALGMGALNLVGALRSRSAGGSYGISAFVFLLWMVAMVVMRTGDVHNEIATIIDVSGYGEAESQAKAWTPHEKASAHFVLNTPFIINRLLWTLVPLAILGWTLARQTRESLALDPGTVPIGDGDRGSTTPFEAVPAPVAGSDPWAPVRPRANWTVAVLNEARWHLFLTIRSWAFRITIGLWVTLCVSGTFVHVVGHADGPLVPRSELLTPFLVDLSYWFAVFIVAGYVGTLARRDRKQGFDEMIDAANVPLGCRVLGRALAVLGFVIAMALGSTVATWTAIVLAAPETFEPWTAVVFNLLVATPALLELAAITFAIHAWIRSPGTAHALSTFAAFVAVVNHELDIVTYPPAQVGVAAHLSLSELPGIGAWLQPALALAGFKLCLAGLFCAIAWLAYPRGTDLTFGARSRSAVERVFSRTGALVPALVAALAVVGGYLHQRIVEQAGFQTPDEQTREDAQWETELASASLAPEFTVAGGSVDVKIDPWAREATVQILFEEVQLSQPRLHAELKHGMLVERVRVNGVPRDSTMSANHLVVDAHGCVTKPCDVQLQLRVDAGGWLGEDEPPWLHETGVWLQASRVVPRLGIEPARVIRAPNLRASHGLPDTLPEWPRRSLVSAGGVAPVGDWRWSITWNAPGLSSQPLEVATRGILDFAAIWLPEGARVHRQHGSIEVWHGPTHAGLAAQVAGDVTDMQRCLSDSLDEMSPVRTVVQSPRNLGTTSVHGTVLFLPEHLGWDLEPEAKGRLRRRADIAAALAKRELVVSADLRRQPGARWLSDGVAQWLALDCVRRIDGLWAWQYLVERQVLRAEDAFGALDAPIIGLAADGDAEWIDDYVGLAVTGWAAEVGRDEALTTVRSVVEQVRSGASVRSALTATLGSNAAAQLLDRPWSSELRLVESDGPLTVAGQRFNWHEGGWKQVEGTEVSPVLFLNDGSVQHLNLPGSRLDETGAFVVYDAWPSYERSPSDNARRTQGPGGDVPN